MKGKSTEQPSVKALRIEKYKHSRFWAVYDREDLVVVAVYRKGARAVAERLSRGPTRVEAEGCRS